MGLFCFPIYSLAILILYIEKVDSATINVEEGLLLLELIFMFLASLLSPGYCVDMEGEEDVEKASLLNKSDIPGTSRGTMCESCGIKRPLRSCHCAA